MSVLYLPKFLILVSGFASIASEHAGILESFNSHGGINIPSLHVVGSNDSWVHPERSNELKEYFHEKTSELVEHEGGHFVPSNKEMRIMFKDYVQKFTGDGMEISEN